MESVVCGRSAGMFWAGHPEIAHGVHAFAAEFACFLQGHLFAGVSHQLLLSGAAAVVVLSMPRTERPDPHGAQPSNHDTHADDAGIDHAHAHDTKAEHAHGHHADAHDAHRHDANRNDAQRSNADGNQFGRFTATAHAQTQWLC
jgi:ABC-type nickel/cobalt efflux system permease component RcnA